MIRYNRSRLVNIQYKLSLLPVSILVVMFSVVACNNKQDTKPENIEETLTSGKVIILVDNTAQPIIEDVLAVFHSVYNRAEIAQVNKTENEIVHALLKDSATVAVLP